MCVVCKMHGVRLKGIKIFESMLKPKFTVPKKQANFLALTSVI